VAQVAGLIERETEVARGLLAQNKRDRALLALKKKRLQENRLDQLDAYLLNVEEMVSTVHAC
jgi:charged multivesicular body protein 6